MSHQDEPIVVEQTFTNSIQQVWEAITITDKMKQWYFPDIPAFKAIVGYTTEFVVQVEDRVYPHHWKVTEVVPQKKISYEWTFEGYDGKSTSEFEIMSQNNLTTLRLTATVLEKFPDNIPEFERQSAVGGWNYLIKESLKKYLSGEL